MKFLKLPTLLFLIATISIISVIAIKPPILNTANGESDTLSTDDSSDSPSPEEQEQTTIQSQLDFENKQLELFVATPSIILNLRLRNIINAFFLIPINSKFPTYTFTEVQISPAGETEKIAVKTTLSNNWKYISLTLYFEIGTATIYKYAMQTGDGRHNLNEIRRNIVEFISSDVPEPLRYDLFQADDYNAFQELIDNKFLELFNEYNNAEHQGIFQNPYISDARKSIRNIQPTDLMDNFFERIYKSIDNNNGSATEIIQYNEFDTNGDTFLKIYLTYDTDTGFLTSYRYETLENYHMIRKIISSDIIEVENLDMTDDDVFAIFQTTLKNKIIEFIQKERTVRSDNDINPFSASSTSKPSTLTPNLTEKTTKPSANIFLIFAVIGTIGIVSVVLIVGWFYKKKQPKK